MTIIKKVQKAPKLKPLVVYDGACKFCCRWIERWKQLTGEHVQYAAYQDIEREYSEIPLEQFQKSLQYIDLNGDIAVGAKAVYLSLSHNQKEKHWLRLYTKLAWFRRLSEALYAFIASHRTLLSRLEKSVLPKPAAQYYVARWLFLRGLGLISFSAFLSIAFQIQGLIGSDGILPIQESMPRATAALGNQGFWQMPTLSWLSSSDGMLKAQWIMGLMASFMIVIGFFPSLALLAAGVLYLSLSTAGNVFFSFQWDILLVEMYCLAFFLSLGKRQAPSRLMIGLMHWLLFRLIFASGVVKLMSGDGVWLDLSAMTYHYQTQPLPTPLAWYAHHLPRTFHLMSTAVMFMIELIAPFFIFAGRRLRKLAAIAIVFLMVLIALTGNYCFFNLLAVLLCLFCFEDGFWPKRWVSFVKRGLHDTGLNTGMIQKTAQVMFFVLAMGVTALALSQQLQKPWPAPDFLKQTQQALRPWRIFNTYGLFANMTTTRPEISIQGSMDKKTWKTYAFKYKAGDLQKRPQFNIPHQPRLDWQMWFAALSPFRGNVWFMRFAEALLEGKPHVLGLLQENPFGDTPPKYLRALYYEYEFSSPEHRRETGEWWTRKLKGAYSPIMTLNR